MKAILTISRLLSLTLVALVVCSPSSLRAQEFGALAWAFATFSDKPAVPKIGGKPLTQNPVNSGQASVGLLFPSGPMQLSIEQAEINTATSTPQISPAQSQIAVIFNSTTPLPDGSSVDESEIVILPATGEGKGNHFRLLYVGASPELPVLVNGLQTTLRRLEAGKVINSGSVKVETGGKSFEVAPADPEDLLVILYEDRGELKHMAVSDQNLINPSAN